MLEAKRMAALLARVGARLRLRGEAAAFAQWGVFYRERRTRGRQRALCDKMVRRMLLGALSQCFISWVGWTGEVRRRRLVLRRWLQQQQQRLREAVFRGWCEHVRKSKWEEIEHDMLSASHARALADAEARGLGGDVVMLKRAWAEQKLRVAAASRIQRAVRDRRWWHERTAAVASAEAEAEVHMHRMACKGAAARLSPHPPFVIALYAPRAKICGMVPLFLRCGSDCYSRLNCVPEHVSV